DFHAVMDFAADDHSRELVLDFALNRSLERPRAERRIVADCGEVIASSVGQAKPYAARFETRNQTLELQVDDAPQLFSRQRMEDHHFIESIEELGPELATEQSEH